MLCARMPCFGVNVASAAISAFLLCCCKPDAVHVVSSRQEQFVCVKPAQCHSVAQSGEVRFCQKCGRHKPPRAHHCRVCRRCVLRMVRSLQLVPLPHVLVHVGAAVEGQVRRQMLRFQPAFLIFCFLEHIQEVSSVCARHSSFAGRVSPRAAPFTWRCPANPAIRIALFARPVAGDADVLQGGRC